MYISSEPIEIPTPTPRPTSQAPAEFSIPLDLVNMQVGNESIQMWQMVGIGDQLQAATLGITFFLCLMIVIIQFKKVLGGDK